MKKITVILLSASLILTACLFCSCEMPTEAADSMTFRIDDRPNDAPVGEPVENLSWLLDGKEIIQVKILEGSCSSQIFPLFDYGNGVIRIEKLSEETPVNTYPVTVEFHDDYLTVNYYVEAESGVLQRSLLTGKDNIVIYYTSLSVSSQPRQGSVMDLPYTPPPMLWQPSSI